MLTPAPAASPVQLTLHILLYGQLNLTETQRNTTKHNETQRSSTTQAHQQHSRSQPQAAMLQLATTPHLATQMQQQQQQQLHPAKQSARGRS
jgi:hypothetical protein